MKVDWFTLQGNSSEILRKYPEEILPIFLIKMSQQRTCLEQFLSLRNRKTKLNPDELRDRRSEENHHLRKRRREKEADKHRKTSDEIFEELSEDVMMVDLNNNEERSLLKVEWFKALFSEKIFEQLMAAYQISGLLLKNKSTKLIEEIIRAGMIPRFFELLQCRENKQLQVGSLPYFWANLSIDIPPVEIRDGVD